MSFLPPQPQQEFKVLLNYRGDIQAVVMAIGVSSVVRNSVGNFTVFCNCSANDVPLPTSSGHSVVATVSQGSINLVIRDAAGALHDAVYIGLTVLGAYIQPPIVDGLVFFNDASQIRGAQSGAALPAYIDMSGNGNDWTVNGGPTYQRGLINSLPGISFDGVNDNLTRAALFANPSDWTILWSALVPSGTAVPFVINANGTNGSWGWVASTNAAAVNIGTLDYVTLPVASDMGAAPFSTMSRSSGTILDWERRCTGFNATGTRNTPGGAWRSVSPMFIGRWADANRVGKLGEVLIYNRALTNAEVDRVLSYLAAKWTA